MTNLGSEKTIGLVKLEFGIDDGAKRNMLRAKQRFNRARQFALRLDRSAAHIDGHHKIDAGHQIERQRVHKSAVDENPAIELYGREQCGQSGACGKGGQYPPAKPRPSENCQQPSPITETLIADWPKRRLSMGTVLQ